MSKTDMMIITLAFLALCSGGLFCSLALPFWWLYR